MGVLFSDGSLRPGIRRQSSEEASGSPQVALVVLMFKFRLLLLSQWLSEGVTAEDSTHCGHGSLPSLLA